MAEKESKIEFLRYHITHPTNEIVNVTTLFHERNAVLERVSKGGQHLLVTRSGVPQMVLIPIADYIVIRSGLSRRRLRERVDEFLAKVLGEKK